MIFLLWLILAVLSWPLAVLAFWNGPPQVSLSAGHRARGRLGIRVRRHARRVRLDDVQVVLVDDVRTSGASLRTAARHLRRLGPQRLLAAVLAATDDRARGPGRGPEVPEFPDSHPGVDNPPGGASMSVADRFGHAQRVRSGRFSSSLFAL